jgi:hypothetical protein
MGNSHEFINHPHHREAFTFEPSIATFPPFTFNFLSQSITAFLCLPAIHRHPPSFYLLSIMDTEIPNSICATCGVAKPEDQFFHLRIPGRVVKNCLQCRQFRNAVACTLRLAFTLYANASENQRVELPAAER